MPRCTHKGCEKEYEEEENLDNGLKGWQCCNKRVTSFDDFLAIPGCTFDKHSDTPVDVKAVEKKHEDIPQISSHVTKDGVEIYDNGATIKLASHTPPPRTVAEAVDTSQVEKSPAEPELPEEDDLSIPVAPGTTCKRRGCDAEYKDETTSRGEGADAECKHHPGAPIFHEGSKGWSCCSRKVLEFEEFLKIKGCKTGKHLFVGGVKNNASAVTEEFVDCRRDWYQTQTHIIMSIFAKNREDTKIDFKPEQLDIDIKIAGGKRYKKSIPLFQPIEVVNSSFEALTTKVEIKLKKANGLSWASLEPNSTITTWTTFGVTGGAGTVGGKEVSQMHVKLCATGPNIGFVKDIPSN
ncbi:hypothetical protein BC938DRAFT_477359 [Jimgerdemannia flammicorona]|uniref:HSP20-like chaperone n=1 Tax=Jimgerdemannia flammicorona TaxID=994334 RepID=A0A433QPF1_9FUNG|nr:hypothetical protein BC938DRAFT_477359 [Jimgerdemannia flammicorona]